MSPFGQKPAGRQDVDDPELCEQHLLPGLPQRQVRQHRGQLRPAGRPARRLRQQDRPPPQQRQRRRPVGTGPGDQPQQDDQRLRAAQGARGQDRQDRHGHQPAAPDHPRRGELRDRLEPGVPFPEAHAGAQRPVPPRPGSRGSPRTRTTTSSPATPSGTSAAPGPTPPPPSRLPSPSSATTANTTPAASPTSRPTGCHSFLVCSEKLQDSS